MFDFSLFIDVFFVGVLPASILSYGLCHFLFTQYDERLSPSLLWTLAFIAVTLLSSIVCALLHLVVVSFADVHGVSLFSAFVSGGLLGFFCVVVVTPILLLMRMKQKEREELENV